MSKSLANGFFGQRGYPKTLHRTTRPRLLHHPSLDKFSLLPRITAIDYQVRLLHQTFNDVELAFIRRIADQFDAEAGRNHGQIVQTPRLPLRGIFVRFFQGTQVAERPGHLVSISFDVSVFLVFSSQHVGYVTCHGRFLGYANYHFYPLSSFRVRKGTKKKWRRKNKAQITRMKNDAHPRNLRL